MTDSKCPLTLFTSTLLVIIIGLVDYLTGYQISFSIFYLIPILWATWKNGKISGIIISSLSAIIWLEADLLTQHFYTHPAIPYWNAFMRFGVFILVTLLLNALKYSLENEKKLARLDHLTQVANSRSFGEAIFKEKQRAQRYQHLFSLAYIDLDNFKTVNDKFGHEAGDKLLQKVAQLLMNETRKTDVLGRLGGDEFAILMPETDGQSAKDVLTRIQKKFSKEMQQENLAISLSIGCVTFITIPDTVDEIINKADTLMYSAKNAGKSRIYYKEFIVIQKDISNKSG